MLTNISSRIQNEIIECQILAQTVKHFIKTNNSDSKLCVGIDSDTCNLMLGEQKGAVMELQNLFQML
ncbi:unnamed protein product [Acanthoscelides obtectus]|uniref:Uncharacterized protein n=1 Tax=Acanthoscelides obtectus TaxID=200917 RepID=A0A9P0LJ16_ACAOB|nr:unnamed protein product [Acanthoscelides obtectus]CAK1636151.1 hypothetical protein AOBTE_LOCUS9762 [Acanthoscelides obtectus]